jgi:hypothetical protein
MLATRCSGSGLVNGSSLTSPGWTGRLTHPGFVELQPGRSTRPGLIPAGERERWGPVHVLDEG